MILDNKEQKDLLLQIIINMPMSGDYKSLSETVKKVDELVNSINEAEINDTININN